jgi:hypothetical protein
MQWHASSIGKGGTYGCDDLKPLDNAIEGFYTLFVVSVRTMGLKEERQ